jgi:hypothetical protein
MVHTLEFWLILSSELSSENYIIDKDFLNKGILRNFGLNVLASRNL